MLAAAFLIKYVGRNNYIMSENEPKDFVRTDAIMENALRLVLSCYNNVNPSVEEVMERMEKVLKSLSLPSNS